MTPATRLVKRLLPRSLLGRSLLIIVTPLVLLQLVSGLIFYETHWDKVSLGLARGVAGDIAAVISLRRQFPGPENWEWIQDLARGKMGLTLDFRADEIFPNEPVPKSGLLEGMLVLALEQQIGRPFRVDSESLSDFVIIEIQLPEGVLQVTTDRKRLFSTTVYVFVLWMVGTSLILFGVATIFMRNQVKPIRRLAMAADNFGKGRDVMRFKPEGATEVRRAASAFLAMRERILRQIRQRTEMLAGVSHDLRTPLTRLRLQLEMSGGFDGADEMKADIVDMERMLEGYLAFARGEGGETPQPIHLGVLLEEVVGQARRKGGALDLHVEGALEMPLRLNAVKRCLTNVIENAIRYADHVAVRAGRRREVVEVLIDDDGPGIPSERREDVFKPFFRLEASRNPGTGGSGLGLTIARDVARSHGGDVELAEAPGGGLRVRIWFPL